MAEFRAPQWVALAKQMDFKWSVRRCALRNCCMHAAVAARHQPSQALLHRIATVQLPTIAIRCDVCRNVSTKRCAASSSGGPRRGLRRTGSALPAPNRLALPQLGMPRAMFVALAEAEAELEPICAHLCGSAAALFKRECAGSCR